MAGKHRDLYDAIRDKKFDDLKTLIAEGVPVNDPQGKDSPLARVFTSRAGPTYTRVLLDAGADVNPSLENSCPLMGAVSNEDFESVRLLLQAGADVNWQNARGETVLYRSASILGRLPILLGAGADPNIRDNQGVSPLRCAIETRFNRQVLEIAQALIAAGADVNEGDPTILMSASRKSTPPVVKLLVETGAAINAITSRGTALIQAVKENRHDNVAMLLSLGADPGLCVPADSPCKDIAGLTPLEIADKDKRKKTAAVIDSGRRYPAGAADPRSILLTLQPTAHGEYGQKITEMLGRTELPWTAETGEALLNLAVALNNPEVARILLDAGIDANAIRYQWLHLLDLKFARTLLEAGLDPSHDDGNWLLQAAFQGLAKMVKLLIDFSVDINVRDDLGQTALLSAAEQAKAPVVQMLLDAGADPNLASSKYEKTPLSEAAEAGRGDIVRALLKAGADVNRSVPGILYMSVSGKGPARLDAVRALIDAGADINHKGLILHSACDDKGDPDIVAELIRRGIDVNQKAHGATPLHTAICSKRPDLVEILLAAGADLHARIDDPDNDKNGMAPLELARSLKARKVLPILEAASEGKLPSPRPIEAAKVLTVAASWKRIEKGLRTNKSKSKPKLNKPATPEQLAALESAIGQKLPDDLKDSLRLHNGQEEGDCLAGPCPSSETGYELLSVDGIQAAWSSWKKLIDAGEFANDESNPARGIRSSWWHAGWIPVASNGGGDSVCVDLAPADGGTLGQVITHNHETAERDLLAPSFAAWLAQIAEEIATGANE